LTPLQEETWPRLEVLVVDNALPDETPAYLRPGIAPVMSKAGW
jgi:hypothetical protein